jgi:hypothetical protein
MTRAQLVTEAGLATNKSFLRRVQARADLTVPPVAVPVAWRTAFETAIGDFSKTEFNIYKPEQIVALSKTIEGVATAVELSAAASTAVINIALVSVSIALGAIVKNISDIVAFITQALELLTDFSAYASLPGEIKATITQLQMWNSAIADDIAIGPRSITTVHNWAVTDNLNLYGGGVPFPIIENFGIEAIRTAELQIEIPGPPRPTLFGLVPGASQFLTSWGQGYVASGTMAYADNLVSEEATTPGNTLDYIMQVDVASTIKIDGVTKVYDTILLNGFPIAKKDGATWIDTSALL